MRTVQPRAFTFSLRRSAVSRFLSSLLLRCGLRLSALSFRLLGLLRRLSLSLLLLRRLSLSLLLRRLSLLLLRRRPLLLLRPSRPFDCRPASASLPLRCWLLLRALRGAGLLLALRPGLPGL